jgi:tetratricopeptide (TPR) repeat protein
MQGFTRTPGGAAPPPTPRPPKLDPALQGWAAYSRGEFLPALTDYGQALSTTSAPWAIHAERGRIQYLLSHPDSASAELALAANAIAKNEHPELAYVYESAAVYEYSRGFALEATHRDSARAAYEHALALDPSFAAAHVRLSALALTRGDTAASLGQLDLAAHEAPGDVVIAYLNARALAQAGYAAECEAELKRAIGLEPWFAAPQLMLALLYDASGLKPQAAAAFARYVAIARKNDPNLPRARERLAALSAAPTPP